jgi:hypothetical protein
MQPIYIYIYIYIYMFVAVSDQAMASIRARLNQIESEIDSGLRRKVRKLNARFSDLPDILVLSGGGKIQRAPKCQEHIKEEMPSAKG